MRRITNLEVNCSPYTEVICLQIRVYGMTYYDETAEYWGDKRRKIINEGRLTARSVKIFADGSSLSFDYLIKTTDGF